VIFYRLEFSIFLILLIRENRIIVEEVTEFPSAIPPVDFDIVPEEPYLNPTAESPAESTLKLADSPILNQKTNFSDDSKFLSRPEVTTSRPVLTREYNSISVTEAGSILTEFEPTAYSTFSTSDLTAQMMEEKMITEMMPNTAIINLVVDSQGCARENLNLE
jgi:hypothetical protein